MHGGAELLILMLAQSGSPRSVPRFVDVTSERRPPPAFEGVVERSDRRLASAPASAIGRLADVRPFPLFDAANGGHLSLTSADVDFDGDPDRVLASPFGRAQLFLNDGQGRFTEAPLCEGREVICAARFLAFEDLDGDGKPELWIAAPADPVGAAVLAAKPPWLDGLARRVERDAARFVAGGVVVACSKEGRRDVTAALGLEQLPPFRCGTVADLDGDGAPEIVLFGGESDDMKAFWERVVPTFARVGADPVAASAALAALGPPATPPPAPRVLARGADGRFAPVAAEFPAGLDTFDVASVDAVDFDGDGDGARDLVLHGGPDDELRMLRNVTRAPGATTTHAGAPASAPTGFVVRTGVTTPAPSLELAAVNGTRLRLGATLTRPCIVAASTPALAAEARAFEGADVVLLDGAAADDVAARARTVLALVSELAAGERLGASLLRIDADGFIDLVAGGVTLAQLRDFKSSATETPRSQEPRALLALPRAEREAHLPNIALAALTKLEAAGAPGLDLEFGLALEETRKPADAAARFAKVASTSPDYARAQLELGRCLARTNREADARAAFEQAVDAAPADPMARFELGRLLLLSKDKEHAEPGTESLRVATYLKPDFADAQFAFGQGLARIGRLDEAITALERALALEPDSAQAKTARDLLETVRTRKKQ